jgi:hypothetical protein
MHIAGTNTAAELIAAWSAATGECPIEARQRINIMRKGGSFGDFRKPAEARITPKVIANFVIGQLAADRHIDAAGALRERGALKRARFSEGAGALDMPETDGTLHADIEALIAESRKPAKDQRWAVLTITVSPTHQAASIDLVNMKAPRRVAVSYGVGAINDPATGEARRIRRSNQLQGSVLKAVQRCVPV